MRDRAFERRRGAATRLTRWRYYLSSIPTLLAGMRPLGRVLRTFLAAPPGEPFQVRLRGGTRFWARDAMDLWILKEVVLDGEYGESEAAIGEGGVVVDVGAGLGELAVTVARRHPAARILAYEPFPTSFRLLEANLELNGVTNVTASRCAVTGSPGGTRLGVASGVPALHSTALAGPTSPEVPSTTLAALLEEHRIEVCDLVKLDCEGAELDILLRSPAETLARVHHLVLELHDWFDDGRPQALLERLATLGFSVRVRASPVHRAIALVTAVRPSGPR